MAEPRVKNSRVKLVTSDKEEEALQTGGVPSSFCRFTSDQGMPAPSKHAYLSNLESTVMVELRLSTADG